MKKYLVTLVILIIPIVVFAQYTAPEEIANYTLLAADGDVAAMGYLANMYAKGEAAVPRDCAKALKYYNMATTIDTAYMLDLGKQYMHGNCVPINYDTAQKYFLIAAQKGVSEAFFYVGVMYEAGMGRPANYDSALVWYMKTAELGKEHTKGAGIAEDGGHLIMNFLSLEAIALIKTDTLNQFHKIDTARTFQAFISAAERGDNYAMMALYIAYLNGNGTTIDTPTAKSWLQKAANAGNVCAMYYMGIMNYSKADTPGKLDNTLAAKWFLKAAENGYTEGMTHIAILYYYGLGVKKDQPKGIQWFKKAAEKGDALAMNNLGLACMTGAGVTMDFKKGAEWFTKAAHLYYANSMYYLGRAYENGIGAEQDYKKAMEWYLKAAAKGNEAAMDSIGKLYEYGEGVPQDDKKAIEWYAKMHKH